MEHEMDNRMYCEPCDKVYASDWSHCDECYAVLREFNPAPVRFAIGTGEVAFTAALTTTSVMSEGCLFRRQAS